MKRIKLRGEMTAGGERVTSLAIIRLVTTNSPQRPIGVEEMRRRVRILDQLDECDGNTEFLMLEDEDAKVLSQAIEVFPWSNASKNLLTIIDDVIGAETTSLKAVEGGKSAK